MDGRVDDGAPWIEYLDLTIWMSVAKSISSHERHIGFYFVGLFFLWLYAQIMEYLLIELWFWKSSINQNRLKWQYSWKQLLLYWGKAQSSKPRPERRCEAGWSGRRVRRQVEARRTNAQNAPEPGHCFLVSSICCCVTCLWNWQIKWNIERPVWPAPSLRPSESLPCLIKRSNKGKRLSFWNKWRFTWWLGDYLWVEYLLFPSYDSLLKSANDNQILGKSHTQTNIINQQPTWRQPFSFTAGSRAMKTLPMSGVRQPFSYLKIYK